MRSSVFEKLARMVSRALISALLVAFAVPLIAQPGDSHEYEISKEVTISGAISGVVTKTTPGMFLGDHLLLATTEGEVDASLGRWAMQGKDALSVTVGQQVEVTGMMQTIKGKEVFITRMVKAGGRVYTLRNQHGIEISPRARQLAAERGESL
jgi:hypothetical protein